MVAVMRGRKVYELCLFSFLSGHPVILAIAAMAVFWLSGMCWLSGMWWAIMLSWLLRSRRVMYFVGWSWKPWTLMSLARGLSLLLTSSYCKGKMDCCSSWYW